MPDVLWCSNGFEAHHPKLKPGSVFPQHGRMWSSLHEDGNYGQWQVQVPRERPTSEKQVKKIISLGQRLAEKACIYLFLCVSVWNGGSKVKGNKLSNMVWWEEWELWSRTELHSHPVFTFPGCVLWASYRSSLRVRFLRDSPSPPSFQLRYHKWKGDVERETCLRASLVRAESLSQKQMGPQPGPITVSSVWGSGYPPGISI